MTEVVVLPLSEKWWFCFSYSEGVVLFLCFGRDVIFFSVVAV